MAQPNVAREPSMDEILASIRKIIESNEPGIPGFPANDIGAPSSFRSTPYEDEDQHIDDIHLTIDDADLAAEFEAEERRLQEQASSVPAATAAHVAAPVETPAVEAAPPQSLADVAARVRAASERHATAARATDVEIENRLRPSLPLAAAPLTPQVETPVVSKVAPSVAAEVPTPVVEPIKVEAMAVPVVAEQEATAIVSPEVGAQVARSFDDLALALDAGPRRSFDEIAQDMLRPMLQEWLDDNLPTLVERLVREEIERVARGPRRG
ncbi:MULTISPECIES: PopZ family protein [unclassified Rhizobium]|uniref:PopZ family protein n=1 Tax=unclassified Rhizobium TaxID=2613769 RepID=UPI0007005248|nr:MULTISPECIES: PopZ family protein [unclassified Rhizobium]KQV33074.1 hypothetical protein ASC86_18050 [Rhizobium sp. Root1212]KRD21534.1 hypothetical protein ASE37_18550 [Rhizobium sp. Root268]